MKPSSKTREAHSLADLFDEYATVLFRYLVHLSGDQTLADELVNETFYRAMLAINKFRGEASMKTWLLRIARNTYLNYAKREKRLTSLDEMVEQGVTFRSNSIDPEESLLKKERMASIQSALLKLSETDRSLLLLTSQEELSYQEISQILEISISAVKVRLFRARQRLANVVNEGK